MNTEITPAFEPAAEVAVLLIEDDLVDEMAMLKAVKDQDLPLSHSCRALCGAGAGGPGCAAF